MVACKSHSLNHVDHQKDPLEIQQPPQHHHQTPHSSTGGESGSETDSRGRGEEGYKWISSILKTIQYFCSLVLGTIVWSVKSIFWESTHELEPQTTLSHKQEDRVDRGVGLGTCSSSDSSSSTGFDSKTIDPGLGLKMTVVDSEERPQFASPPSSYSGEGLMMGMRNSFVDSDSSRLTPHVPVLRLNSQLLEEDESGEDEIEGMIGSPPGGINIQNGGPRGKRYTFSSSDGAESDSGLGGCCGSSSSPDEDDLLLLAMGSAQLGSTSGSGPAGSDGLGVNRSSSHNNNNKKGSSSADGRDSHDGGSSDTSSNSGREESDKVDPTVTARLIRQVESMFSDDHLAKDGFLLKHVRRRSDGFVSLKLVAGLRKVKQISREFPIVLSSLRESTKLEINGEGTKVRRIEPLTPYLRSLPTTTSGGKDKASPASSPRNSFISSSPSSDTTQEDDLFNMMPRHSTGSIYYSPNHHSNYNNYYNGQMMPNGNGYHQIPRNNGYGPHGRNSFSTLHPIHTPSSPPPVTPASPTSRNGGSSFSKPFNPAAEPFVFRNGLMMYANTAAAVDELAGTPPQPNPQQQQQQPQQQPPPVRRRGVAVPPPTSGIISTSPNRRNSYYSSSSSGQQGNNGSPPREGVKVSQRPKSNSYCEGLGGAGMSAWLQRRTSCRTTAEASTPASGVLRQPRGPDGTKGFATGYRDLILKEKETNSQRTAFSA